MVLCEDERALPTAFSAVKFMFRPYSPAINVAPLTTPFLLLLLLPFKRLNTVPWLQTVDF
jgi:hypothetical protein